MPSPLEFLRPEKRVNQITHDKKRHDYSDQIFQSHMALLQTIATEHVQPRDHEEENRNDDKYDVSHVIAPKLVYLDAK